jgi:hypothetical protein
VILCLMTSLGGAAWTVASLESVELADPTANALLPVVGAGACAVSAAIVFFAWPRFWIRILLVGCVVGGYALTPRAILYYDPIVEEVGRVEASGISLVVHRRNVSAFQPYYIHVRLERALGAGIVWVDVVYRTIASEAVLSKLPDGRILVDFSDGGRRERPEDAIAVDPVSGRVEVVPR